MSAWIKVILVVGARPNFMKAAPLYFELKKHERFRPIVVHTGQHYDDNMSKIFFDDLELPRPDLHLGVGSDTQAAQTAKIMIEFERVLVKEDPDLVVVVGDVNSTLACSITTAKYRCVRNLDVDRSDLRQNKPLIAHIEAGLRSFDLTMPEEINRMLTDAVADLLFTTEPSGNENLKNEGVPEEKIHYVGNIMIDSLIKYRDKAQRSRVLETYDLDDSGQVRPYVLVTLHRPGNVDTQENLRKILDALAAISKSTAVVFPAHPRTQQRVKDFKIKIHETDRLYITDPLGYLDFLKLMCHAALVITDSGGIQEETTFLGIPCLTIRPNTERPITIEIGTNRLVSAQTDDIIHSSQAILSGSIKQDVKRPELWDGKTAERIANIFIEYFR